MGSIYQLIDLVNNAPMIFAHTLNSDVSVVAGFLHPLLGTDHLLAMVAVGLLSALIGGRAIWSVPAAFVGVMTFGAIMGFFGVEFPLIEYGIAGSVLLLGIALVVQRRIPELVALLVVAFFALFHGNAHGTEVPSDKDFFFFFAFVIGFVVSTAGLHVIGAALGYIVLRNDRGSLILRLTGVVLAIFGINFLLGI